MLVKTSQEVDQNVVKEDVKESRSNRARKAALARWKKASKPSKSDIIRSLMGNGGRRKLRYQDVLDYCEKEKIKDKPSKSLFNLIVYAKNKKKPNKNKKQNSSFYEEMESNLDKLVFKAINMKDVNLADKIREARRFVSSKLL